MEKGDHESRCTEVLLEEQDKNSCVQEKKIERRDVMELGELSEHYQQKFKEVKTVSEEVFDKVFLKELKLLLEEKIAELERNKAAFDKEYRAIKVPTNAERKEEKISNEAYKKTFLLKREALAGIVFSQADGEDETERLQKFNSGHFSVRDFADIFLEFDIEVDWRESFSVVMKVSTQKLLTFVKNRVLKIVE